MRFVSDLVLRVVPRRMTVLTRARHVRGATAIMLALGVAWMTIQPAIATYAQQSNETQLSSGEKPSKGKKNKAKKSRKKDSTIESSAPMILPQIFSNGSAQQSGAPVDTLQKAGKPMSRGKSIQTVGGQFKPQSRSLERAAPVNVKQLAEGLELAEEKGEREIEEVDAPQPPPDRRSSAIPILRPPTGKAATSAPTPSVTGISPAPTKTFKGEFLSGGTIPPDTMGAVGTTHIVTVSNDRMRIQTRDGVELSRATLNSFWTGTTIKGTAVTSAFDTKVFFDRFNSRFILVSSLNGPGQFSGMGLAVTQTADPTGVWNRFTAASDPASTGGAGGSGHAIDYPSVGFNKNWIVVDENTFNYSGTAFTSYYGQQIFVFDKAAAYANTLSSVSLFDAPFTGCVSPFETQLGCGFTMAPAITEDNTTDTEYLVEDWDSTAAQLRLSKLTGTPAAPVITVGTQFPQSTNSWRFDARRISTSGGYMPQRENAIYAANSQRIMANDSRIQNAVLRGGSLWTTHTVMLSATPQLAGVCIGGTSVCGVGTNIDNHSGIQWWQINPTIETGLAQAPIQRGRIEDATADNCHDGNGGTRATGLCVSTATQVGTFFAFPNISVNMNNDVMIGFSQFSPLTWPTSTYAFRANGDAANTTRDPVVFRPGQDRYNIGAGAANTTARQNRWGDYSSAQTDPLDDTNFWVIQEYGGTHRSDFLGALAGPWETWWALVKPSSPQPTTSGSLIISEFRLRGPQGAQDEYVELFNPGTSPLIVSTTDNSDGWALASNNGTTTTGVSVIPNGTVIPAKGHFLFARNPDGTSGLGPTVTYSLNSYAGNPVRGADSDTGYHLDIADNVGIAIFKTSTIANFSLATRMDAAGFSSMPAGLFKEGNGIPAISTTTPLGQYTFYRDLSFGDPKDTGFNESDFVLIDTAIEAFGTTPKLGGPGPENLDGPLQRNATIALSLIDPGCPGSGATSTACANARDFTPVTNGLQGTLSIRRKFTNVTGSPVTKLRFRLVNVTTLNSGLGVGYADLRALTSPLIPAATLSGGGTTAIQGLTLEEPPTQSNGGGYNSTLAAGVITLNAPLANGTSINVQFLTGVQQAGRYRFFIQIEALP